MTNAFRIGINYIERWRTTEVPPLNIGAAPRRYTAYMWAGLWELDGPPTESSYQATEFLVGRSQTGMQNDRGIQYKYFHVSAVGMLRPTVRISPMNAWFGMNVSLWSAMVHIRARSLSG
jgi:hypothetical protein